MKRYVVEIETLYDTGLKWMVYDVRLDEIDSLFRTRKAARERASYLNDKENGYDLMKKFSDAMLKANELERKY